MMPRPARVVAVARRDLQMELAGRRGWVLPIVMAGLLLPISGAPRFTPKAPPPPPIPVAGDVPAEVLALDRVQPAPEGGPALRFEATATGLAVHGGVPPQVRTVLDDGDPNAIPVIQAPWHMPLPGRTLLLALISASTLTGALSASIAGERQARTLVALLSAAITREEVVLGKWLAWGGFGAVGALGASIAAVAFGRVPPGWWILPIATVPLCSAALGLWLVRRASDVIGGTTVTLRVIPAAVSIGGLGAWFVGLKWPLAGAAVPLGGALVAAGATWGPGMAPAVIATVATATTTGLLLRATWRDLDEVVGAAPPRTARAEALTAIAIGMLAWWPPLLGPLLWATAGNPDLAGTLPRGPGVAAAALGLLLLSVTWLARRMRSDAPWAITPPPAELARAAAVGLVLGAVLAHPLTPLPEAAGAIQERLHGALACGTYGPFAALAAVVATELLFRGWLPAAAGEGWALAAWIVVCTPLDPLGGMLSGAALGWLARRGGLGAPLLAHALWALPWAAWGFSPW